MNRSALTLSLALVALAGTTPLAAQAPVPQALSYADIVDLADGAPLVVRAQIRDQATVEPERSPGLAPGHVRLYVEARTTALIAGNAPVGESLRYLVDLPLNEKGKAPKLKKQDVLLFARPVAGQPGAIQLVEPDAQFPYSEPFAESVRSVLAALVAPSAPPRVTGVRDALAVEGTLVGESETQLFLDTEQDGPVSVTVVRRPNQAPRWGVSWTEIVDQAARPPRRETIEWYRLACFLPASLPAEANLSTDPATRQLAERDYALVLDQLGDCPRTRS